jgi:Uracil DNA glycosylase superfamily
VKRSEFFEEVARLSESVFREHSEVVDYRAEYPWLTGCLGDPFAPVWFVAENPSLTQVAKAVGDSQELQWSVSPGDKLLRQTLVKHGFKTNGASNPGGWRCYITDVVKSATPVKEWNKLSKGERRLVAEVWAPVLAYEIREGKPRVVVVLGEKAEDLVRHLLRRNLIPHLPNPKRIHHYSYIASRAEGKRGPLHPERVAEWDAEFGEIARLVLASSQT